VDEPEECENIAQEMIAHMKEEGMKFLEQFCIEKGWDTEFSR